MPAIVISYRCADSGWIAGRVFDRLEAHFGRDSVFMDIDNIPLGRDFREHIKVTLNRCDVLLAIIGPNWLDGPEEKGRLNDESDWVRIEIETALAKKVPVIPVLIDQAQMPKAKELPEPLRELAFHQAAKLDTGIDFSQHDDYLAGAGEIAPPMRGGRNDPPGEPKERRQYKRERPDDGWADKVANRGSGRLRFLWQIAGTAAVVLVVLGVVGALVPGKDTNGKGPARRRSSRFRQRPQHRRRILLHPLPPPLLPRPRAMFRSRH
jgi:hypothetical protein